MRFFLVGLLLGCNNGTTTVVDYTCSSIRCTDESTLLECVSETRPDDGLIAIRENSSGPTKLIAKEYCSFSGLVEGLLTCQELRTELSADHCD